jgi:hypothetical protein
MAANTSIQNVPSATPGDCCQTASGAGATGSTPLVDDSAVLSAWVPSCAGGGAVPTAADAAYSEDWDPL